MLKKFKIEKSDIVVIIIVIVFINTFILIKLFSDKSGMLLLDYTSMKAVNIATFMVNEAVKNELYEKEHNYLIEIDRDKNGNIVNLNLNNVEANKIMYDITNYILEDIYKLSNGNYQSKLLSSKNNIYYIPFGVIYGFNVLSRLGPKIPFKISYIGGVESNIKTNIRDYGINSFIIEIILNINIQFEVILPYKTKTATASKSIILDSKVVQGQIPRYFAGSTYSSLK